MLIRLDSTPPAIQPETMNLRSKSNDMLVDVSMDNTLVVGDSCNSKQTPDNPRHSPGVKAVKLRQHHPGTLIITQIVGAGVIRIILIVNSWNPLNIISG